MSWYRAWEAGTVLGLQPRAMAARYCSATCEDFPYALA